MADTAKKHILHLENREILTLSGVNDLVSFDETQVVFALDDGNFTVAGSGLCVTKLALESGDAAVKGRIEALVYSGEKQKKNALSRFFK